MNEETDADKKHIKAADPVGRLVMTDTCYADNVAKKWRWKMGYCKKHGIPPAQSWAWNRAEDAYRADWCGDPASGVGMDEKQLRHDIFDYFAQDHKVLLLESEIDNVLELFKS